LKQLRSLLFLFGCAILVCSCATTKTLDIWKDEQHTDTLKKTLIIAVARQDHIRNQFENVLTNHLTDRGVLASPAHKALPQLNKDTDPDTARSLVKKSGFANVLILRSIDKSEVTNRQAKGKGYSTTSTGWHSYYTRSHMRVKRSYDTEFFTLDASIYQIGETDPFWSYLSRVRVEDSRQMAVNEFVPVLVEQLADSDLLPR